MRLGDLITVKVKSEEADFWIVRRGTLDKVGSPTKEYNPEHYGIKVVRTDVLMPDYLFYMLQYIHSQGVFKRVAKGSLSLVNITAEQIKNIPIGQKQLDESANPVDRHGFKEWFNGSKVIDAEGNPQVCYHGSFESFAEFAPESTNRKSHGLNRLGYWFDTDARTPSYFAGYVKGDTETRGAGGNVMPCYLSIKKPLYMDSEGLWGDDQEKMQEYHALYKRAYGGLEIKDGGVFAKSDGKPFPRDRYVELQKEVREFEKNYSKTDGWHRLISHLPNGVKSTNAEVDAFKASLIAEGYDGVYISDTLADHASRDYDQANWWIAFHPNQIKSTFAKSFSSSNNITEANKKLYFIQPDGTWSPIDGRGVGLTKNEVEAEGGEIVESFDAVESTGFWILPDGELVYCDDGELVYCDYDGKKAKHHIDIAREYFPNGGQPEAYEKGWVRYSQANSSVVINYRKGIASKKSLRMAARYLSKVKDNYTIAGQMQPMDVRIETYRGENVQYTKREAIAKLQADQLTEVFKINDLDDSIQMNYRDQLWGDSLQTSKHIGRITNYSVRLDANEMGDRYLIMDGKKPICQATVVTVGTHSAIKHIWLEPAMRGKGVGLGLYLFILKRRGSLVTDLDQTDMSKNVWKKLIQKFPATDYDSGEPVTLDNFENYYGGEGNRKRILIRMPKKTKPRPKNISEQYNAPGTGQRTNTERHWWWNARTDTRISTEGHDHTPFAASNLELFGIDEDQFTTGLLKTARSAFYNHTFVVLLLNLGWVRCGIERGDVLNIQAANNHDALSALKPIFRNFNNVMVEIEDTKKTYQADNRIDISKLVRGLAGRGPLNETSEPTLTLWHGGKDLESSYHEMASHKGGRWEHGPGLYLTNHYDIAARYAKGGRKLYKVTIRKGRDSDDVLAPWEDVQSFAKRYIKASARKEFLEMCQTTMKRRSLSGVPVNTVSTLALNLEAISNTNTAALRAFMVEHGADYTFVRNYHGGASVYVIHNPKVIQKVEIIKSSSIKDGFELPAQFNSVTESIGDNITFYHRSYAGPRTLAKGFKDPTPNSDYGAGVYGLLDWNEINTAEGFGSTIVKCEIPNDRILCLDPDLDPTPIADQLKAMGIEMSEFHCMGYTLDEVQQMLNEWKWGHNFAQAFVSNGVYDQLNGMILRHIDWGPIISVRNRDIIKVTDYVIDDGNLRKKKFISLTEGNFEAREARPFDGVVYHCSNEKFSKFNINPKRGAYFANEADEEYGRYIYKCHVKLAKAAYNLSGDNFEIERDILISQGYDGRIVDYVEEIPEGDVMFDVIAFSNNQIKILDVIDNHEKAKPITERTAGKNIYDTLYTKLVDLLSKPNLSGDMRPVVDLTKEVIQSFEQNGVATQIYIKDGIRSVSGAVYNKKIVNDVPTVKMVFEFPTVGAISGWCWGETMPEHMAKKYANEMASAVSHEFVHYLQQASRDKHSFKQNPIAPNTKQAYYAYLSNPDEVTAYATNAAQEFLEMAKADVARAKRLIKLTPQRSLSYKYYMLYVKPVDEATWKRFNKEVYKYIDSPPIAEKVVDTLGRARKPVFKNPSRSEFDAVIKNLTQGYAEPETIRALLDPLTNDVYLWDGYYAPHGAIKDRQGIPNAIHLLMNDTTVKVLTPWRYEREGYGFDDVTKLVADNRCLKRIYGGTVSLNMKG